MSDVKLDALVVLGRGWNHDASKRNKDPLSSESKLNALAAGELYQQEATNNIILSGGKTAGEMQGSEAEAMKAYLIRHYPNIPEEAVRTENGSIDTAENAQRVKAILDELHALKTALLTVKSHGQASEQLFTTYGIPLTETFASEDIFGQKSPRHAAFIRKHQRAPWQLYVHAKETLRRKLLRFDRTGKLVNKITSRTRK